MEEGAIANLQLGMTIQYLDQEFIVASVQETITYDGRKVILECLEPLYAVRIRMEQETRRKQAEEALRLMSRINKEQEGES